LNLSSSSNIRIALLHGEQEKISAPPTRKKNKIKQELQLSDEICYMQRKYWN